MPSRPDPEEVRSAQGEAEGNRSGSATTTGEILRGIAAESSSLLAQEIELLRAELREKIALLQSYATAMAIGSALMVCAAFFLLSAVDEVFVAVLGTWFGSRVALWLAPLLLAVILGAGGVALLTRARGRLREKGLVPTQTIETLRENTTWIKERLK